jgi:tRNA modification GTPase
MFPLMQNDTICAISTPPGMGAIALIRLSGLQAVEVADSLFHSSRNGFSLKEAPSHTVHFGTIGDGKDILDEVLITLFKMPHSYTGEDVIEISCHGSVFIQQKLLELLLSKGVRLANPGEFTLRAFLNGKFDLSQAEAVADLIAAQSSTSHDLAMEQIRGGFSKKIKELREKLMQFTALIELELDFSEEHVEFADRKDLLDLLLELENEISLLVKSFEVGNVIKKGIPVTITGKPNVGKSTLLNAILNEEKAIVSEIPGTTRDAIEDTIIIGGYSFRFIDTAGLRSSPETIESMGIERTWEKIHLASVILYVFDVTIHSFEDVLESVSELQDQTELSSKKLILVGNKTDMLEELPHGFKSFVEHETIFVSAKRKENIHILAESLLRSIEESNISDRTIISNSRHLDALKHALSAIESTHKGLETGLPSDLLTVDIRTALHYLGEITGEITTEEILGAVFSRFCIGK